MIDYEKEFERPTYVEKTDLVAATFKRVYGWMCGGLLLSGLVAWYTATSGLWQKVLMGPGMMICLVVEVALVIGLSAGIRKMSAAVAALLFAVYAAVNGLTLSIVFIAYKLAVVERVFFITAGMFGGFALYGTLTRSDLSSIGSVCGMGLWGLIVAGLVNIFFGATRFDWIISIAGIVIFSGLTMYDAQKVKALAAAEGSLDSATARKLGILGALNLYLDFVNLFLYLLRFFGRSRD